MKSRPVCHWFDNNQEADGPATKGNVNVYMLDANKAIIKLRTSAWALSSNYTLFFTRNFREGWTSVHLISVTELLLTRPSKLLEGTLGADRYLGRTLPSGERVWGRVSDGPQVKKAPSLARWQDLEGWLSLHTVIKVPQVPTLAANSSHLPGAGTALEVVLTVQHSFFSGQVQTETTNSNNLNHCFC